MLFLLREAKFHAVGTDLEVFVQNLLEYPWIRFIGSEPSEFGALLLEVDTLEDLLAFQNFVDERLVLYPKDYDEDTIDDWRCMRESDPALPEECPREILIYNGHIE